MSKSAAASSGRGGDANRRQKKANDDEDLESNYGDSADEYDLGIEQCGVARRL